MTTETLTTASTSPWTCPAGVTSVQVELWGGGGKGGTRSTNGGGGGGGGGAYSKLNSYAVTPGNTYAFQVGTGSTNTVSGAANDSWWVNTSTGLAKAGGSVANNTLTGGAGGASGSGVGDVKASGGAGGTATASVSGGGGEAGGASGTGGAGSGITAGAGVNADGGDGAAGRNTQGAGSVGNVPGGGGSGGFRASGATQAGGTGAAGRIILTYEVAMVVDNASHHHLGGGIGGEEILLTMGQETGNEHYGYTVYTEAESGYSGAPFGAVSPPNFQGYQISYLAFGDDGIGGFTFYVWTRVAAQWPDPPPATDFNFLRISFVDDDETEWVFDRADAFDPAGDWISGFNGDELFEFKWQVNPSALPNVTPSTVYPITVVIDETWFEEGGGTTETIDAADAEHAHAALEVGYEVATEFTGALTLQTLPAFDPRFTGNTPGQIYVRTDGTVYAEEE